MSYEYWVACTWGGRDVITMIKVNSFLLLFNLSISFFIFFMFIFIMLHTPHMLNSSFSTVFLEQTLKFQASLLRPF